MHVCIGLYVLYVLLQAMCVCVRVRAHVCEGVCLGVYWPICTVRISGSNVYWPISVLYTCVFVLLCFRRHSQYRCICAVFQEALSVQVYLCCCVSGGTPSTGVFVLLCFRKHSQYRCICAVFQEALSVQVLLVHAAVWAEGALGRRAGAPAGTTAAHQLHEGQDVPPQTDSNTTNGETLMCVSVCECVCVCVCVGGVCY